MTDQLSGLKEFAAGLIGDQAGAWDVAGQLPLSELRKLGERGLLCAEVPPAMGGLGLTSGENGELTAFVGSLCSSTRSIMTSHGMAAWMVSRFGDKTQRRDYLAELTSGKLAAVGFSEPGAGSDLAALSTELRSDGNEFVLSGQKMWVTGASYADYVMVLARFGDAAAVVAVPTDAPGVELEPIDVAVLGCRAAGHINVRLDDVRLPASAVLGGGGQDLTMLFTVALSYGRISVAWGCTGIVRACLKAAVEHARRREQSGKKIGEHQLVARHLAELFAAEQVSTRVCEQASAAWQAYSPDLVTATVLAKHVAAGHAAHGSSTAVQVLGSAGAVDGHVVARAYRDSKVMEIIEGSNEISQLILAHHALSQTY
ncbi:acyl-CoA dehydrogenase [Kineosporia sp. NBRC 101677]|uniref:acyl-CoA dehydrogenase family protein n=1 Tax=Kineosporia sp. NBRC 101677 TaxID=3032197 RepID=UPI0024A18539|nr:acyl-CoA dehydrogenase family protein [Kineosporia sp. NBRC 101677]GLY16569.1 acyl-CoA dehydrogenase [Kineosporia sp. NBRC 101677]